MKIPETSANGPYYGNNENGQWQGVMADAGVSGVVGSGDGYHQHPPAYVGPQPGYMVGSPFYGPPTNYNPQGQQATTGQPDDFADYMWMENEEEFDKQVMQQLEEEALMEQCIEAMLEDERERERGNGVTNGHNAVTNNGLAGLSLEEQVSKSTLNPLAAEFVPTFARSQSNEESKDATSPTVSDEKPTSPPENASQTEVNTPAVVHPEVSAMGILPIDDVDIRQKESNISIASTPEVKTAPIVEKVKKAPTETKSDSKLMKSTKTEERVEKETITPVVAPSVIPSAVPSAIPSTVPSAVPSAVPSVETVKVEPQPSDECQPPKPINYAAAAKSKVKKTPVAQVAVEKVAPPKPAEKVQPKPTKAVRKNSNKS